MLDQGLDAAEGYRQSGDLDLLHELPTGLEPATDPEAKERSRAVHLLGCQLALRVIGGSRISHPLHRRMLVEHLRDRRGALLRLPDAQPQGLEPAVDEPRLVRIDTTPVVVEHLPED